jgi:hypothetical protein
MTCAPRCAAVPATRRCASRSRDLDNARRPLLRAAHPCDRPHAESGDVARWRLASPPGPRRQPPHAHLPGTQVGR